MEKCQGSVWSSRGGKWDREEVISLTGWLAGFFSAFSADCLRHRECCTACTGGNGDKKGGKIQWGAGERKVLSLLCWSENQWTVMSSPSAVYYLLRNLKFHVIFFFFFFFPGFQVHMSCSHSHSPAHFIFYFLYLVNTLWVYNGLGPSQAALWLTWACLSPFLPGCACWWDVTKKWAGWLVPCSGFMQFYPFYTLKNATYAWTWKSYTLCSFSSSSADD